MNQGVHVHSKVIVIDPFGKNPVVMTGSHNLGHKASTANDDNLMIVEGNAPLAAAYAANIIAIYQTYRWNTYVDAHAKDPPVWHGLVDNETWQDSYLAGTSPDLAKSRSGSAKAPAPAAGSAGSGSPAGRHQGARRNRNRAIAARGNKLPKSGSGREEIAVEEREIRGSARGRNQANSVEAERQRGETNAGQIEARARQEGSRKDEARASEKGAPKSRMARMKSTRAAAVRRASGKIASGKPRRGR